MCLNLTDVELYNNIKNFYKCADHDIVIRFRANNSIEIKINNENIDYERFWKYIKKRHQIYENEEVELFIYVGSYPTEYKVNNTVIYQSIHITI